MPSRDLHAVRVAKALGDATRFAMLRIIAARGEISCQDLTALFRLAQATVSHHLKVLSQAGLVSAERRGQFHIYRLVPGALEDHAGALVAAARGGRRTPVPRRLAR